MQALPSVDATSPPETLIPRPYLFYKEPPCLGRTAFDPTEQWLAAMLKKRLQTAWDLVSQTRLWHEMSRKPCMRGKRKGALRIGDEAISDRFVTQPGGVDTTVKKFE